LGKVETVFGPISPDMLGITLPHEHLLCDITMWHTFIDEASRRVVADEPITLENRGEIHRNPFISKTNLKLLNWKEAAEELLEFKVMGGNSLVELTTLGIGRDVFGLRKISHVTGVNIICATGFYMEPTHPSFIKKLDVNGVCDFIVKELTEGLTYMQAQPGISAPTKIDLPVNIRAGIIKCAILNLDSPDGEKILKGAARAQKKTGAPLTIHPPPVVELGQVIELLQKEGANLEKCYISHVDLAGSDGSGKVNVEYHKKILDKYPVNIEYDTFGSLFVSDDARCFALADLIRQGYEKQLLLSQDTCVKMLLIKYGGWGYAHLLKNVVPKLKILGVAQKQINTIMIDNPKRILAF
jgi:phosphotriesterase-related protein